MRRLAGHWSDMSTALTSLQQPADQAMNTALSAIDGQIHDAMSGYWRDLAGGDGSDLANLIKTCDNFSDQLEHGATDIEYAKLSIYAAIITMLAMAAVPGFGEIIDAAADAAVKLFIRKTIQNLIDKLAAKGLTSIGERIGLDVTEKLSDKAASTLVMTVAKQAVTGSALNTTTNLAAQEVQIAEGHRQSLDTRALSTSALSGAVSAPIAGAIGSPTVNALSHGLTSGLGKDAANSILGRLASNTFGNVPGNVIGSTAGQLVTNNGHVDFGSVVEGAGGGLSTADHRTPTAPRPDNTTHTEPTPQTVDPLPPEDENNATHSAAADTPTSDVQAPASPEPTAPPVHADPAVPQPDSTATGLSADTESAPPDAPTSDFDRTTPSPTPQTPADILQRPDTVPTRAPIPRDTDPPAPTLSANTQHRSAPGPHDDGGPRVRVPTDTATNGRRQPTPEPDQPNGRQTDRSRDRAPEPAPAHEPENLDPPDQARPDTGLTPNSSASHTQEQPTHPTAVARPPHEDHNGHAGEPPTDGPPPPDAPSDTPPDHDPGETVADEMERLIGVPAIWGNWALKVREFEEWMRSPIERELPPIHPDSVFNCWEMILYAAAKTGVLSHAQLHELYTFDKTPEGIPPDSWFNNLPDQLSPSGRQEFIVGDPRSPAPRRGDLVYFNGYNHVAIATGRLNSNGSPELYSFWPPPGDHSENDEGNWSRSDTVKETGIVELYEYMMRLQYKDMYRVDDRVVVTFGRGLW